MFDKRPIRPVILPSSFSVNQRITHAGALLALMAPGGVLWLLTIESRNMKAVNKDKMGGRLAAVFAAVLLLGAAAPTNPFLATNGC
jgi:hypothetical protein